MDIKVNINIDEVQTMLEEFPDQLQYAIAKGINKTLTDAQEAERKHMHEVFHIRRESFANKSVKVKPFANKHTLEGTIQIDSPGGKSDIFTKFEDQTEKTSITGGRIAVPTEGVQPNIDAVIPKNLRPANLKNSFLITSKSGKEFIMRQVGRGKNRIVQLAYVLQQSVPIKPVLKFVETVQQVVDTNWNSNFSEAYEEAIASRRPQLPSEPSQE